MKIRQVFIFTLIFALGASFTLSVQPGLAHGDPTSVALQQALGPYDVTVFTSSNVNDQPHLHLSARINIPDTQVPVWSTKVYFQVAPIHSGGHVGEELMVVEASQGNPANGFTHDVSLTLPSTGAYEITVIVRDPQGQGGQASFAMNIQAVTIWVKMIISALFILSIAALLWLVKEGFTVWTRGAERSKPVD